MMNRTSMPYENPIDPRLAEVLSVAKPGAEDELTELCAALTDLPDSDPEHGRDTGRGTDDEPPPAWLRRRE